MSIMRQTTMLVTVLSLASLFSLLRNFVSMNRALFRTKDNEHTVTPPPPPGTSKLHYIWDGQLESRYSTTHQKIRGQFSLIMNDNDETNDGNNDFQHKGILRTSSQKHGKWRSIRFMRPNTTFEVDGEIVRKAGTNYSKYVDDMRFVVDANETIIAPYLKENKTISDLFNFNQHTCHVLRVLTGRDDLDVVANKGIPPIALRVTADCDALDERMNAQGNTVLALYGMRMITAFAKVDFEFQCRNGNSDNGDENNGGNHNDYTKEKSRKLRWVFPWFASHQSASDDKDPWPYRGVTPTEDQVCSSSNINLDNTAGIMPLEKMADLIRDDVRKMTLQLVGSRSSHPTRIHQLVPLDVEPWIPDVSIDDVVIHLPCYDDEHNRDIKTGRHNKRVGILQFSEYTKYIRKDTGSIGIITGASIKEEGDVCHLASALLRDYLQDFYSNQPVAISVYENDSLPLQYARIAMAKQSFSSFSTFGVIPIIGTFGEGYFQPSVARKGVSESSENTLIRRIITSEYKGFENIQLMNGNVLSAKDISRMDFEQVSAWLLKSTA